VAQAKVAAAFAERLRYERGTVVSHHALDSHVLACEARHGVAEERAGGLAALVGKQLHVRQTRGVIDGYERELGASLPRSG